MTPSSSEIAHNCFFVAARSINQGHGNGSSSSLVSVKITSKSHGLVVNFPALNVRLGPQHPPQPAVLEKAIHQFTFEDDFIHSEIFTITGC